MKNKTLAQTKSLSGEQPRSTAYYYADLERFRQKNQDVRQTAKSGGPLTHNCSHRQYVANVEMETARQNPNELSECVETKQAFNDGAIREVPPVLDRQLSLPEYNTPENVRRLPGETYSTAGTFPMPKEKEPLLAELEIVGRLPLTELESSRVSSYGVRRSRSWYLCCPNVGEEDMSRESSWRYSSLRPVTVPPIAERSNAPSSLATSTPSDRVPDVPTLLAERAALTRALASERQRAAAEARAHDARLAELHGVIAELVRRRDNEVRPILEEHSDECESTTQLAGELDNEADRSRTDQDTSSLLSPAELPAPQSSKGHTMDLPDDATDNLSQDLRPDPPPINVYPSCENCATSLNLSEKDSELCLSTARCCQFVRQSHSGGSCEREFGSVEGTRVCAASPGRTESRQAKIASRVKLKKTEENQSKDKIIDETWCIRAAEKLASEVCAQADLREAVISARNDGGASSYLALVALQYGAKYRALKCALEQSAHTAHALYASQLQAEAHTVAFCEALGAADAALEAYDVLLALAETAARPAPAPEQRRAAEAAARQLLARLTRERTPDVGEALLPPGPWLRPACASASANEEPAAHEWTAQSERRLRGEAARLKADTVRWRKSVPPPKLFSFHDNDEEEMKKSTASMVAMEQAVMLEELLTEQLKLLETKFSENPKREETHENANAIKHKVEDGKDKERKIFTETTKSRHRQKERHWLDTQASETDL